MKNEVTTQQHPLWAWAYLPNNLQGVGWFLFSLQNRMEGEGEEKDWERRYSCDSCDSFQGRGIWTRAAFKLLLLYLTYYIYIYIYIYIISYL